jgi:hypothetical protein
MYFSGSIWNNILATPGLLLGCAFFYLGAAFLASQGNPITKKPEDFEEDDIDY